MAPELHMDLDPLTLDLYLEQSEGMLGLVDMKHAMHLDLEQALVLIFLPLQGNRYGLTPVLASPIHLCPGPGLGGSL